MERLATIDRRLIYLVALVIVVTSYLVPLGLPLGVSHQVRQAYEAINALPDGCLVIVSPMYDAPAARQVDPFLTAFLTHCARRGYRILVLAPAWGLEASHLIVSAVLARYGYVYGRDYLEWDSVSAGPRERIRSTIAWMQAATTDFARACDGVDYHGQPLAQLPIAREVPRLTREHVAALLVVECGTPGAWEWFTHVAEPNDIPMTVGGPGFAPGEIVPFASFPPLMQHLQGLRQCAEYEYLLGFPGQASKTQDVFSLLALMVLAFVILGNVGFLAERAGDAGVLPAG